MDNKKCAQCGKPFPEGLSWCNCCDKESESSRDSPAEVALEHQPGTLEPQLPVEEEQAASLISTLFLRLCAQGGKPFPEEQEWFNLCEKDSESSWDSAPEMAEEPPSSTLEPKPPVEEVQPASFIGNLFLWLFKGVIIAIGLLFVLGGGLLGLCGMAGHGSDGILILIAIMPIALGGYFIVLALSGRSDVRYEPLDDISQQKTIETGTDNKTEVK
jgi:hypothetical protein